MVHLERLNFAQDCDACADRRIRVDVNSHAPGDRTVGNKREKKIQWTFLKTSQAIEGLS
jgi:hypothetical protein